MLTGVQFPVILSVIILLDFELMVQAQESVHDNAGDSDIVMGFLLFDLLTFYYLDH